MSNKKLVIHLIQEQIRNQVLTLALENLGFDCSAYTLNISEIILNLMEFGTTTDGLYQQYFKLVEKAVANTNYRNFDEKLKEWAFVIYNRMIELKSKELPP